MSLHDSPPPQLASAGLGITLPSSSKKYHFFPSRLTWKLNNNRNKTTSLEESRQWSCQLPVNLSLKWQPRYLWGIIRPARLDMESQVWLEVVQRQKWYPVNVRLSPGANTHWRGKALYIVLWRDTQTNYFDLAIVCLTLLFFSPSSLLLHLPPC